MGLIPGGLILSWYWDFYQCWYCEGWSRISLITRAICADAPCVWEDEAGD